jgi:hypothetical protein
MLKTILTHGAIAGLIAGLPLFMMIVSTGGQPPMPWGLIFGYMAMILAGFMIYRAIRIQRDTVGGGTIAFWPAVNTGLAVTAICGIVYMFMQEWGLRIGGVNIAEQYAGEAIAEVYGNTWIRLALAFMEVMPMGVMASLISAALLRGPTTPTKPR